MVTEILILALLFLTAGIFLLRGKGKWLIAGYNILSKAERKKFDEKKVCRAAGVICIVCCVFLCAIAYMGHKVDSGLMSETDMLMPTFILLAALIAAIIAAGVYIGKKPNKKSDKNESENVMKKIISILIMLSFTFTLSACNSDQIAIEDYEWKMRTVMRNDIEAAQNEDELVVAVGEADELYPDDEIVDVTLTAKDGEITVTDTTNSKTYSGTYTVIEKTPDGMYYEITIDGVTGYATAAATEHYDGSEIPALPINIDGYSVYFIPKE